MSRLIDRFGSDISLREARERYAVTGTDVEFRDFAVQHLGCVSLVSTPSVYRIKIAIDQVAEPAECRLYDMLAKPVAKSIVVTLMSKDASYDRICFSTTEASEIIRSAVTAERSKRVPRFLKRASQSFALGGYPALDHMLSFYRFNGNVVETSHLQAVASQMLHGRFLIVGRNHDDALRIQALGLGYRGFDRGWCSRSNGERIEDQPDLDYGAWLREDYFAALVEKAPKLDDVDAIIFRPHYGNRRFNYRRLVLPFVDPTGGEVLLSASITDPTVDLRAH